MVSVGQHPRRPPRHEPVVDTPRFVARDSCADPNPSRPLIRRLPAWRHPCDACQMVPMEAKRRGRMLRRPWTMLAAIMTGAHHGFELASGIGIVGQPELGLVGASALWATQIPTWIALAARGGSRWDRLLAVWSGTALGGAVVHFLIWPWRRSALGIPILTEAEGLDVSTLPTYNTLLYGWAIASALSISREVPSRDRRWVLLGFAALPLLRHSAKHHFSWIVGQAATRPAWWNRGVRVGSPPAVSP